MNQWIVLNLFIISNYETWTTPNISHRIETIQLICSVNISTGFYMTEIINVVMSLLLTLNFILCSNQLFLLLTLDICPLVRLWHISQLTFTCLKWAVETLGKGVKYVIDVYDDVIDVLLMFLLLTSKIFHMLTLNS